jgi:FlaA1/EpsC-like NDP-sugar epimerase
MIAVCVLFYSFCGVYKSLWQHPGIGNMLRLALAVLLSSFSVYVSLRLRLGYWPNPGLGMMAFYFLFTMSASTRLFGRASKLFYMYLRRFSKRIEDIPANPVKTLLVGAGESAATFLLNKSQHGIRPRSILAIVDSDERKHGYTLHGVRIFGDESMIPHLAERLGIEEIIVAVPSIKNENLRRIVHIASTSHCKVRILSGLSADKTSDMLRDVSISDLLGRPETSLDEQGISQWLRGKTVLVTGGGGSIGSELCRQFMRFDAEKIVIFDISENNSYNLREDIKLKFGLDSYRKVEIRIGSVQDERRLGQVFDEFKPSIVFHAAAFKHVPLMEECPRGAIENNVLGTYRTALCACRHGVERFVMISTDKAVNPTNVMGATKRLAELLVLGLNIRENTEFVCVRFGNVLDSNGSVIPLFKRQIESGGPVTVTHPDIMRYFMTIPEAARLVLEAGAMANGGEIFILDMGEPVKIVDLAENLIRMAGLTPGADINIEFTGLRPGEKLYEELLLNEEGLTKTMNDKIFVVHPVPASYYSEITEILDSGYIPEEGARGLLKRFVPEYNYDMEEAYALAQR